MPKGKIKNDVSSKNAFIFNPLLHELPQLRLIYPKARNNNLINYMYEQHECETGTEKY